MHWKDFFKLKVFKHTANGAQLYFQSELKVPDQFSMPELIMGQFDHWKISETDKKLLSLNLRKILLCHEHFHSKEFRLMSQKLADKICKEKSKTLELSTTGGGIYLFLPQVSKIALEKKIICETSELPLPIFKVPDTKGHIQFVYRPEAQSYLSQFPSLWEKSELLELFEQNVRRHSKVA